MGRIQQEFGDQGLTVVAVNTVSYSSMEDWKQFWKSKGAADVTWANDANGELVRQFRVFSLGTTVIIDKEGHITYRDDSATPYDVLRSEVIEVLAASRG